MGILKLDSWHSDHAGKTVDEAIEGYRRMVARMESLEERASMHEIEIDNLERELEKKYNVSGGDIKGEASITGGASIEKSILKVRMVEGYVNKNNTGGDLYLNKNSSGNVFLGKSLKAKVDNTGRVYGAIWNDFAEFRKSNENEAGRVVCETENGLCRSYKRLQPGAEIISDTFGFAIGETNECQTPVAVAGRVLAYPYEDWWTFELGEPVCAGPNGTVSKMTRREVRKYPDRIIGTVSELPLYEFWGENKIPVNGRIWIRVR